MIRVALAVAVASAGAAAPAQDDQPPPSREEQLEERLRRMEEANRKLAEQLEASERRHAEQMAELRKSYESLSERIQAREEPDAAPDPPAASTPAPASTSDSGRDNQPADPGSPVPSYRISNITNPKKTPAKVSFGPGFEILSENDEFQLQVHIESQVEARIWQQGNQDPVNSGLFLPRQRIFFNGRITKPIEYMLSINRGFGNLDVLDAYVNFHPDDRFQVRLGRFMTPLIYEQYAIQNMWLLTPERSLFTANLGLNRQVGLMAWGYLLDKRVDYAAGVFNGPRNSYEDVNYGKDFIGYLNARPFQKSEGLPALRNLNLGGSVAFGRQDQLPQPRNFRVATNASNAGAAGNAAVPFLMLNPDVLEQGDRLLGSAFAAYFHRSLSLIGEWQYGYVNYVTADGAPRTRVPVTGFYVGAGYFLTGEHLERRTMIQPRRPFAPCKSGDAWGLGAFELVARYSEIHLGRDVFTAGLADPDLWSNFAQTTEVGLNWYWNANVKFYFFWQHGVFGSPVLYRPGPDLQLTTDLFWLRFQLYY